MIHTKSLIFISILMAAVTSPKIITHNTQSQPPNTSGSGELENLLTGLFQTFRDKASQKSPGYMSDVYFLVLPTLRQRFSINPDLKNTLNTLGMNDEFLNPLIQILDHIDHLHSELFSNSTSSLYGSVQKYNSSDVDNPAINSIDGIHHEQYHFSDKPTINDKFLIFVKNIFEKEFAGLENLLSENDHSFPVTLNSTASSVWVLIKSTWQRLLAYVEEENSLETFMQHIPVKIIDRIMSLGDDINLMSFLAKKVDPDFAKFLVDSINPFLGPIKNFDTFYNVTRDYGLNGVVDYFTSEKFTSTINILSRLISAYLEDRVSGDLVNQYIELISFDNPELRKFYKSIMKTRNDNSTTSQETQNNQRFRRDVLEHIASTFRFGDPQAEDFSQYQIQPRMNQQMELQSEDPKDDDSFETLNRRREITARDGGYGGSGYGGGYGGGYGYGYMSTLDPYIALGALALGTLLGFLLFRLLNGTRSGRRDIGDGSLSLWDSDLPDQVLPWGSSVQRTRRDVHDTQSFSLPPSLRGDVWSSDPLVADNLVDDYLHEDDIAHHLNHLWRLYRHTNETACVQSHLCDVMANTTAQHLTGKHSSLPLLMASVSNLMGVVRSGQLMDHVTQTVILGHPYTCPTPFPCCSQLI